MTYAIASRSSQEKTIADEYLTAEQENLLVVHVRERTELLKNKQDNFTLEEQKIRIRGERAFNTLVDKYRRLIWSLVYRFNFSERITTEEMYQFAVIVVNRAINNHKPNRNGRQAKFSQWVFVQIRQQFINLFRDEIRYEQRCIKVCNCLISNTCLTNKQTSLKLALEENFREQIEQIITTALTGKRAEVFQGCYLNGESPQEIAARLGLSERAVYSHRSKARKKLMANPRFQELAQEYTT